MFSCTEHGPCRSSSTVVPLTAVLVLCPGAARSLLSHRHCPSLLVQQPVLLPREGHFPRQAFRKKEGLETSFFHKILYKLFCIYFVRREVFLCHKEAAVLNFRLL